MSGKMTSAAVGIGGDYPGVEEVHNRVSAAEEDLREELCARIAKVIGRNLTREEIRRLSANPDALDTVRFQVDSVLRKVASWYPEK